MTGESGKQLKLTEVTQQDLLDWLPTHERTKEVEHVLARSCWPHCVAVISEVQADAISALPPDLKQHVGFLLENGAHHASGSSNHALYDAVHGWHITPMADLLRAVGHAVVMQNLVYSADQTNVELAAQRGRVRTQKEHQQLERLKEFGGSRSEGWLAALADTLSRSGNPIVSIKIPNLSNSDIESRHAVVVLGVNNEVVRYFDPDKHCITRYGAAAEAQGIVALQGARLYYEQPQAQFLKRMIGEVMHVFPKEN